MLAPVDKDGVLGRGIYAASEAVRLLNFQRNGGAGPLRRVSRQTVIRWLRGYDYVVDGERRYSPPLWQPDYAAEGADFEVSFRDLIELRFVRVFRALGLSLPTIRLCFAKAAEEVRDARPFSTRRFRTDGKTIFMDITEGVGEGELVDLRHRQIVFKTVVAPSLMDLEFEADAVVRWFPLGHERASIVVDPTRAFGRPISVVGGVPTEVLASAVDVEGSLERAATAYEVPLSAVKDAVAFEQKLAA